MGDAVIKSPSPVADDHDLALGTGKTGIQQLLLKQRTDLAGYQRYDDALIFRALGFVDRDRIGKTDVGHRFPVFFALVPVFPFDIDKHAVISLNDVGNRTDVAVGGCFGVFPLQDPVTDPELPSVEYRGCVG